MMNRSFFKRVKTASLALFAAGFMFSTQAPQADDKNLTVLELFTSQGCSSCPPADALLGLLDKRSDILALTFPVDYWDYIGWKDTFASPAYTKRQRAYAQAQGKFQVYTPQIMINGASDAVGSSRRQIERMIRRHKDDLNKDVRISATDTGNAYTLNIRPYGKTNTTATLWVAAYQKTAAVDIGRGENRGRTVTYTNVVRIFKPIGKWSGGAKKVELPKSDIKGKDIDGAAVFLQESKGGKIISASRLSFSK